jgi:hypothetical protein
VQSLVNPDVAWGLLHPKALSWLPGGKRYFYQHTDESKILRPESFYGDREGLHGYLVHAASLGHVPLKPGRGPLMRAATWLSQSFELGDLAGRQLVFRVRARRVFQAFRSLSSESSTADIESAMRRAGIAALEPYQRAQFIANWARLGLLSAVHYAADAHTSNVHFRYERYQKSAWEMGETGRALTTLLSFPRAFAERFVKDGQMLLGRHDGTLGDRVAAATRILFTYAMFNLTQNLLSMLAGEPEDKKDKRMAAATRYGPLGGFFAKSVASPWETFQAVAWRPGGIGASLAGDMGDWVKAAGATVGGDQRAYSTFVNMSSRLARSFLPFYKQAASALAAGTQRSVQENWDEEGLRRLIAYLDPTYEPAEPKKMEALSIINKARQVAFGTDLGIEELDLVAVAGKIERIRALEIRKAHPRIGLTPAETEELAKTRRWFEMRGMRLDPATRLFYSEWKKVLAPTPIPGFDGEMADAIAERAFMTGD